MATDKTIVIRRFRTGSVFRIAAAGIFSFIVPFFTLMGVLALFGLNTLKWNGEAIFGVKALLMGPIMGLIAGAIFAGMGGLSMAFGLWLYSKMKPLSLRVLVDGQDAGAT